MTGIVPRRRFLEKGSANSGFPGPPEPVSSFVKSRQYNSAARPVLQPHCKTTTSRANHRVTGRPSVTPRVRTPRESRVVIAAIVPAYNEARHIQDVLAALPPYIGPILVIDDGSRDATAQRVLDAAERDPRIMLIRHQRNLGVGAAMVTGFREAMSRRADIVVKVDGDGQMSPQQLPELLCPLVRGEADYTKGNRFRDFRALEQMPILRRAGNMALSFLTKAAVGYWNCFDPCNGYVAIRGDVLTQLPLEAIKRSYFFETSMLLELYLQGAVVRDVPMPARYGNETTHLSVPRVMAEFPIRLVTCFGRRMALKNFIYDFSMESIYLLTGIPILMAGLGYGLWNWSYHARAGIPTPTGTVMIAAILLILASQLLLSAIGEDLRKTPRIPLSSGPLRGRIGP